MSSIIQNWKQMTAKDLGRKAEYERQSHYSTQRPSAHIPPITKLLLNSIHFLLVLPFSSMSVSQCLFLTSWQDVILNISLWPFSPHSVYYFTKCCPFYFFNLWNPPIYLFSLPHPCLLNVSSACFPPFHSLCCSQSEMFLKHRFGKL